MGGLDCYRSINNFVRFDKLYKEYFNTAKQVAGKTTTRQQSPRMGATPWRQGSQNLVPDRDRVDPTLNSKVEKLRGSKQGASPPIPVTAADLKYIISKYNIQNLSKTEPRFLGKTGIKIFWNNSANNYYLQK